MMRSIYIILLLNILSIVTVWGQSSYPMTVTAQPNLKMRKEPSSNGKFLNAIPFGDSVQVYATSQKQDTLNGIVNYWMEVEYQGSKGYVWGQYLSWMKMSKDKDYRITFEGGHCAEINYDPTLNWYGVYETKEKDIFELTKIDTEIKFWSSISPSDLEKEGFYEDASYVIQTNKKERSYLLIGSKTELKEGEIFGRINQHGFLYPEQTLDIYFEKGVHLAMKAKITPYLDSSNLEITQKYELTVAANQSDLSRYSSGTEEKKQTINQYISMMKGAGELNAMYHTPIVSWYGDLDGDDQIDLLISAHSMTEGCGGSTSKILLLSSKAKEGEFVGKADEFNAYGCGGC